MLQNTSLRTKAIAFAIAISTIPVLAIGGTAYYFAQKSFSEQIFQSKQARASDLQNKINLFMRERYENIQGLANLDIFTNPKLRSLTTRQEKEAELDQYIQAHKLYDSIAVFNLNGDAIAQTQGKALSNHKDRVYFQAAVKTGRPFISQPLLSQSEGTFNVYVSAPIKDAVTGDTIAVIRTRMPVKFLEEAIKNFGNQGDNYYLINADGEVFISPEGLYVTNFDSRGKAVTVSDQQQKAVAAQSIFPVYKQLQAANQPDTLVSTTGNTEQLIAYTPTETIAGLPNLEWDVIIATDTAIAFAAEQKLLLTLAIGTGLTTLLAGVIAILFANRTTRLIQGIANALASSSTEIGATVEQQERITNEQASAVNQTTVTIEELGAASRQSAEQAEASTSGARQALNLADNGTKAVHKTIEEMSTLKERVGVIAEQIMRLSEQTMQIGSISDLVGDLANQTNMLALNAAVEAARAGEHGKGFSVVAGEIRKLADQSKKSAEKINALVTDVQASINSTVMVTDEGTKSAQQGLKLTQGTAETFAGVADAVNHVFLNSQQISLSSKQQAVSVQQVVSAMNEINIGAKDNAAGINQVKVSTQQLNQAAQQLQAIV